MIVIDGKKLSQEILSKIKTEVAGLSFRPIFCDILVGDDKVSMQYVDMKSRVANSVGILFHKNNLPFSITTDELVKEIEILNKIPNMCGIILQLPLPIHIDTKVVLDTVDPKLDVDCLGSVMSEKFYNGDIDIAPPTALACMEILNSLNLNLKDKKIVVLGWGNLVGKPVSALLHFFDLNPIIIRSQTINKEKLLKEADIVISGIGKGKYIRGDMIKKGVILIDAGTSESNSGIVGDVEIDSVKDIAGYVSPVPGGVGPMTVAMLLKNVLTVAKNNFR